MSADYHLPTCRIQPIGHYQMEQSHQSIVEEVCDKDEDWSIDDESEDEYLFEFGKLHELLEYDYFKPIVGVGAAEPPCDLCDIEGNKLELQLGSKFHDKDTPFRATVMCKTVPKYSIQCYNTTNLSNLALEHLKQIKESLPISTSNSSQLTKEFINIFSSHFICGKFVLGGLFETVIICEGKCKRTKYSNICKEIIVVCGKRDCDLLATSYGMWYDAKDILSRAETTTFSESDLSGFKIRLSKFGGKDASQTFQDWMKCITDNPGHLFPLNSENVEVIPAWRHSAITSTPELVQLLIEANLAVASSGSSSESSLNSSYESCIETNDIGRKELGERLGLAPYTDSDKKITVHDVMSIKLGTSKNVTWKTLPWVILEKLISSDLRARDDYINRCEGTYDTATEEALFPHPLDVFLIVFECCDPMLQQLLAHKMLLTRLAVPLLIPNDSGLVNNGDSVKCMLWPLETSYIEWHRNITSKEGEKKPYLEGHSLIRHPMHIASFMRFGSQSFSKSKLINEVLSAKYTFCNYDSSNGANPRYISDGLVEMSYFLPSDNDHSIHEEILILNLRGDAEKCRKQTSILQSISTGIIITVDKAKLQNLLDELGNILSSSTIVIITCAAMPTKQDFHYIKEQTEFHSGKGITLLSTIIKKGPTFRVKSMTEVKIDVQNVLNNILKKSLDRQSLLKHVDDLDNIICDEHQITGCQQGIQNAQDIRRMIDKPLHENKNKMVPLQGDLWVKWVNHQKILYRGKEETSDILEHKNSIRKKMNKLRKQQMSLHISHLITMFHKYLITNDKRFFVQYLKLELDILARSILRPLQQEYRKVWSEYVGSNFPKDGSGDGLRQQVTALEKQIEASSFGFEHLLRELGQIYEASMKTDSAKKWEKLPEIAAQLLLQGYAFEIMDGDAGSIPLRWVNSVILALSKDVGDTQLYIISVIGIQSSGKSTLLNTMFGLEFPVGAGRCTRGIYAQLVPVTRNDKHGHVDFLLVLDSEGLRAEELAHNKYLHDNELATLVIGLSDLTVINLKGENTEEIKDVLQIVTYAFLRMKKVDEKKKRQCYFVHQNVSAIDAHEKMTTAQKNLLENLDRITKQAGKSMSLELSGFSDVIQFNIEKDVFYIPDLWDGTPPMATVKVGYAEKVQELKESILTQLEDKELHCITISAFTCRIKDLWTAILSDDFVFNFKNNRAIKAFVSLERSCHKFKFELEQKLISNNATSFSRFQKCESAEELFACKSKVLTHLEIEKEKALSEAIIKLDEFYDFTEYKDILINEKVYKENWLKKAAHKTVETITEQIDSFCRNQNKTKHRFLREWQEHKTEIMLEALKLAKKFEGKELSKKAQSDAFEELWKGVVKLEDKKIPTHVVKNEMYLMTCRLMCCKDSGTNVTFDIMMSYLHDSNNAKNILISGYNIQEEDITSKYLENIHYVHPDIKKNQIAKNINNSVQEAAQIEIEDVINEGPSSLFRQSSSFITKLKQEYEKCVNVQLDQFVFTLTSDGKCRLMAHTINYAINRYMEKESPSIETSTLPNDGEIKSILQSTLLDHFDGKGHRKDVVACIPKRENMQSTSYLSLAGSNGAYWSLYDKDHKDPYKDKTNTILQSLDAKLMHICSADSQFTSIHGTDFIMDILDQFEKLPPDDIADIAVVAINHAAWYYQSMNQRFEARHANLDLIKNYKDEVKVHFTNCINNQSKPVSFVNVFGSIIHREVIKTVKENMAQKISKVVMEEIGSSKFDLMVGIMKSLLHEKDPTHLMRYIGNAYRHALYYVKKKTNSLSFGQEKWYRTFATQDIDTKVRCCQESARNATDKVVKDDRPNEDWLKLFIDGVENLSLHKQDFCNLQINDLSDLQEMQKKIDELFDELPRIMKPEIDIITAESVDWGDNNPCMDVMNQLWGCKEQCPFCEEPCMRSEVNHKEPHRCIEHRPSGICGRHHKVKKEMILDTCSGQITTAREFRCFPTCPLKNESDHRLYHNYRKYKKYFPNWEIAPDSADKGSVYWKWVVVNYVEKLVEHHSNFYPEPIKTPNIPTSWHEITEDMAIRSLSIYDSSASKDSL